MERSQLSDIAVFVEVARCKSFRGAAKKLGITPGAVSTSVHRFENRLGVRLLERTTRSVALSVPGEFLFSRCRSALEQIGEAITDLDTESKVARGVLRISAPRRTGPLFLDDLLMKYAKAYPDVRLDVLFNDSKVDLVTSGVDVALRAQTILDEDTHAIPVGRAIPMTIVGSPNYLKERGTPKRPSALVNHDGICFAFEDSNVLAPWQFKSSDGTYSVMPKCKMTVNDLGSLLTYCEKGLGLAYTFAESTSKSVAENRLVPVLKKHIVPLPKFSINYLSKRHMPLRVRAFIELAKQQNY